MTLELGRALGNPIRPTHKMSRVMSYPTLRIFMLTAILIFPAPAAYADKEVGMKTFKGQNGPATEAYYVAETQEEWERLWALVGETPKDELKEGKQTGVGIFLGPRPKGDKLESRKAQNDDGDLEVKLKLKKTKDPTTGETVDLRIQGAKVP